MRNFIKILFLFVIGSVTLTSCKKYKPDFHKVKYVIDIFDDHSYPGPVMSGFNCTPAYNDDFSTPEREDPTVPLIDVYTWDYEYWQLVDGEKVKLMFSPIYNCDYTMSVYIDGTLVESKTIYSVESTQGGSVWFDSPERVNEIEPIIEFTYHE